MANENLTSSIEQCISDIAECPICNDLLQDNRCLPCLHMFCLKCLDSYRNGKPIGKPLPCPVCRREFSISKSTADLPRNFFIDKLLDAHKIKNQDILPKKCEICTEDTCDVPKLRSTIIGHSRERNSFALAARYCCDCRQYICLSCERQHKKIKATSLHKIIDSRSVNDSQALAPMPTYCITHKTKEAELYCQDCKMVICWQCKALSHSSHTSIDVSSATKDLVAKLEEHIEQISGHLYTKQNDIRKLTECKNLYTEEINAESETINKVQRRICRNIADNGDHLRKALNVSTITYINDLDALRVKLEVDVAELNKHKVYVEQVIHLGNVSDLCEYTNTLILKTARLAEEHKCRIIGPSVAHLSEADIQDFLTGKRTDIAHQYSDRLMDNADKSKNNKSQLQDKPITTDQSPGRGQRKVNGTRSWPTLRQILGASKNKPNTFNSMKGKDWSNTASSSTRDSDTSETKERRRNTSPYKQTKGTATDESVDESGEKLLDDENTSHLKQMVLTDNCVEQSPRNLTEPYVAKPPAEKGSSKHNDWSLIKEITSEDDRIVCGITVLDSMVYVVAQDNNSISVYSATEFIFVKHLAVDRLINPNDIVSCKFNNCLYICDWGTACIFRVKDGVKMEQVYWSTGKDVGCLSVTTEHTVLVAGHLSGQLKEYASNGKLIRSIELIDGFKPWHAIRLVGNNTEYLICEGNNPSSFHRVCLIDFNGNIINSFGGVMGSDENHLCGPYHLTIDKSGCILVNDCNNSRILLLSKDLKFINEIIPSSANLLRRARRMYLDEDANRLYVADNAQRGSQTKDGRILVFSSCGINDSMV